MPYWDVVDKIQFGEKQWLRVGYYRMAKDQLQWCAQPTLTEPFSTWEKLLIKTAVEKTWFRELLADVVRKARKQTPVGARIDATPPPNNVDGG